MSAFLPRETSIRMSESMRTVISREAGPDGHHGEDSEHTPPHRGVWSVPYESRRTPAWLSSARPGCRGNAPGQPPARVPRRKSFDSARECAGHSRDVRQGTVAFASRCILYITKSQGFFVAKCAPGANRVQ